MPNIVPVILAAGDSTRMGYPKALLPLGKDTFLTRILKTLGSIDLPFTRVVLGAEEARIRASLQNLPAHILVNPNPALGQISSMRLAAENLDPDCRGCLFWPVDQPFIRAELVQALLDLFVGSSAPFASPICKGQAGHPAIFGHVMIRELMEAPLDVSPKAIVDRHRSAAVWLPTTEAGTVEDVDTRLDYLRTTGETLEAALERRRASCPDSSY